MNITKWKKITLSEIFYVKKGDSLNRNDCVFGVVPYIGASENNNSVTGFFDIVPNRPKNTFTINRSGSVGHCAYHEYAYFASENVFSLLPKFECDLQVGLFLQVLINKNRFKYNYGRTLNTKRILEMKITLPMNDGHVDVILIKKYINSIKDIEFVSIKQSKKKCDIIIPSTFKWKTFKYNDIFSIHGGYYNKKPIPETNDNLVPFIGASSFNNGVTDNISLFDITKYDKTGNINNDINLKIFQENALTISNNGSIGYAFHQEKEFTCSHDVYVVYLKDGTILSKKIGLFISTIISKDRYRWNYGRKQRSNKFHQSTIKLPVNSEGNPDWILIDSYIASLPYSEYI